MTLEADILEMAAELFTEDSLAECRLRLESFGRGDLFGPFAGMAMCAVRLQPGEAPIEAVMRPLRAKAARGDLDSELIAGFEYALDALELKP